MGDFTKAAKKGFIGSKYDPLGNALGLGGEDAAEAAKQQEEAAKAALAEQRVIWGNTVDSNSRNSAGALGSLSDAYSQATGATQDANATAQDQLGSGYDQARSDLQQGGNRLSDLYSGGLASGFEADPGYQFRLSEGMKAINQNAAARGGRMGGDTLKALQEHGQNFASNEFNNYANRAMGMAQGADQSDAARYGSLANLSAGYGQNASNLTAGTGSQLANLYSGLGQQQAGVYGNESANNSSLGAAFMGAQTGPSQYAGGAQQAMANAGQQKAGLLAGVFGGLSDAGLKQDVEPVPSRYGRIGLQGYSWTWNGIAERLGVSGRSEGVIAQDVAKIFPWAVGRRGEWLTVHYGELDRMLAAVGA